MIKKKNIYVFTSPELKEKVSVAIYFTTRLGGVSKPPFDSLNLGFHSGDAFLNVLKNRRIVGENLGFSLRKLTCAEQVHGAKILEVKKELIGKGGENPENQLSQTDGIVTKLKRVPLAMFFADCLPILLVDPKNKAVGIAHGGWRGLLLGVVKELFKKMELLFKSIPQELYAFIGPSIGPCCYEIGKDVAQEFEKCYPHLLKSKKSKIFLDLKAVGQEQLKMIGIQQNKIVISEFCTSCRKDLFYSYRRDKGRTGRQAAIIFLI